MEGDFAKHGVKSSATHLSAPGATESNYARRRPLAADRRLSCQAKILGDLVIDVPASSQVHRQVVRKAADEREITLNPVVSLHYVEVREPDMHNPASDLQRLCQALEREWQLLGLDCDLSLLHSLQPALRQGKWAVTVGGARAQAHHRRLAGPARARLRPGGRCRLDHHRHAPVRPADRQRAGDQRRA